MPDINENPRTYGTKITAAGEAMIAACILNGTKLNITHAAAGDGGGAYCQPLATQTALVNECWRGEIAAAELSSTTPNMIDVKVVIPGEVSGFIVREMGLFSAEGGLVAVCNTPDTEKTSSFSGAAGKLTMVMHILIADASVLEVAINPSLDTVSREELDRDLAKKLDKLAGEPGQVPVTGPGGNLEAGFFRPVVFPFAETDWARSGADYEIVIPAGAHKRKAAGFGFHIFHLAEGSYTANTWAAFGTDVRYEAETGDITLVSSDCYSGKILFVG